MATFHMDLQGEGEIYKMLKDLTPQLEKKVLSQAMRNAAKPILAEAKSRLSGIRVSGETTDPIRRRMKIRALKAKRGSGRIGVQILTPTRDELGLQNSKWYPPAHIELGTKRTPPRPFLRGALQSLREQTEAKLIQEIRTGIERIAKA